jgi:hypothetical protein
LCVVSQSCPTEGATTWDDLGGCCRFHRNLLGDSRQPGQLNILQPILTDTLKNFIGLPVTETDNRGPFVEKARANQLKDFHRISVVVGVPSDKVTIIALNVFALD